MASFSNKTASIPGLETISTAGTRLSPQSRITAVWLILVMALQPYRLGASINPANMARQKAFEWQASSPRNNPDSWKKPVNTWRSNDLYQAWLDHSYHPSLVVLPQSPPVDDDQRPLLPPDGIPLATPGGIPAAPIPAGECELVGEISDAASLDPIAGAIIDAIGTGKTTETDAKGRFKLTGLPPGTYTLEASKLGYFSESGSVTTVPGQVAELRVGLRIKPADDGSQEYTLEEETLIGEYQGETAAALGLGIDLGNTVSSGISKEDFTKTGVSDAASAVGKISGANIVGGKFAVVRGLADRYVTTLFNGAAISSADPSRKAVQLDIFPTSAIQGVDISKTYFPNLPGDFGGGTIKIKSLSIPKEQIAEVKYKITWNSNLKDRMLVHPNRELGYWGDVDKRIPDAYLWNLDANGNPTSFNPGGNRVIPNNNNNNPNQRAAQVAAGQTQQALADAAKAKVLAFHNSQSFLPKVVKPEAAESHSMVYGDRFKFENGSEAGFVAAFQHATSDEVNALSPENRLISPARSWDQERYSRQVDWSVYLSGGVKLNENHEFNATYFKKRIASDDITHGSDFTISGSDIYGAFAKNDVAIQRYGASAVYKKEFWTIDPIIRDTEIMQLSGSHKNDFGTKLDWSITRSSALESRPHSSTFQNGILDFTDPSIRDAAATNPDFVFNPNLGKISTIEYQTFVNDGNGTQDSSRETQFIEEETLQPSLDLSQSIFFTDDEEKGPRLDLSVGGSRITKDRTQSGRVYLLRTASWERWVNRNPPSWWPSSITPFSPGSPLSATTMADGSPLPAGFNTLGEYLASNPDLLREYFNGYGGENVGRIPGTGTGSTSAIYVQPDAPYYVNGSGLEVRNVDSNLSLTSLYGSGTFHTENWRVGGGLRWEEEVKSYEVAADPLTSLRPTDPARRGDLTTDALIPSIVAGLDIIPEKSWINLAWSKTVARPTFHEFLPIESIAQDTGIVRRGNPNLDETAIENLDASVDFVFNESMRGTFSVFHKDLTDPIVVVQAVDQGVNSNTYINGDSGVISGFELEGSWKGAGPFSVTANYTFIDSTLNYEVNQGISKVQLETRFPFQPGQILNLTLGWEPQESPWSAFLTTNFTDEYPTILRSDPVGYDVWLKPLLTLDLIVARKFKTEYLEGALTLGFRNLLDLQRQFEYRGGPTNGAASEDGTIFSQDSPGRSYSIELKLKF